MLLSHYLIREMWQQRKLDPVVLIAVEEEDISEYISYYIQLHLKMRIY